MRHFLVLLTGAQRDLCRAQPNLYLSVEALPPQCKVDPSGLGKLLEAVDAQQNLPSPTLVRSYPLSPRPTHPSHPFPFRLST